MWNESAAQNVIKHQSFENRLFPMEALFDCNYAKASVAFTNITQKGKVSQG